MLLLTIVAVGALLFFWIVALRGHGRPAVADPATDRQRRYIGYLVEEREISNPPDPNHQLLSKADASELIDKLLDIPTRDGDFDREHDGVLTRWWRTLPLEVRIAWYLDKRGHAELVTQRTEIYDAVREDDIPGTVRAQNKRIAEVLNGMLEAKQVRVTSDGVSDYKLTAAGEQIVPPTPGSRASST